MSYEVEPKLSNHPKELQSEFLQDAPYGSTSVCPSPSPSQLLHASSPTLHPAATLQFAKQVRFPSCRPHAAQVAVPPQPEHAPQTPLTQVRAPAWLQELGLHDSDNVLCCLTPG